jgi:hypothetical protein
MKHYSVKVHVRPELRYGSLLGGASLPEALAGPIENVFISQWQPAAAGGDHLWLHLSRPSDEELLAEIGAAAIQVGYALVEAEVEEFVDHAVQGAIIGFCGGGTATSAATRNSPLALIAALVSAYIGNRVGVEVRTLIATRHYQLHRSGQWIVTEVPLPAQQPTLQPDPSAAFLPAWAPREGAPTLDNTELRKPAEDRPNRAAQTQPPG